jgi:hypothetical protein
LPIPPPPPRPGWVNAVIAGGAVVVALAIYLGMHMLFPPSIKGDWTLSQCTLTAPQYSALADLINAALTGQEIKGQMEVKGLNEFSLTVTATDSGTVQSSGQVNAPGGIPSSALTFTSNSTHKPVQITYSLMDNTGQMAAFGIPAGSGSKLLYFGINAGAGEVFLHGTPTADTSGGGQVDNAVVGTWAATPFNLNPPNNLWSGSLAIHADGTYVLTATHTESGLVNAAGGNWSAQLSNGSGLGAAPFGMGSGLLVSGHYSFSGSSTLNIGTGGGTFTFKRGW